MNIEQLENKLVQHGLDGIETHFVHKVHSSTLSDLIEILEEEELSGYDEEGRYITYLVTYNGNLFSLAVSLVDPDSTALYLFQGELYDKTS